MKMYFSGSLIKIITNGLREQQNLPMYVRIQKDLHILSFLLWKGFDNDYDPAWNRK